MEPWYKVITPRREVREGRSFDPSEFAIALEQVVSGIAPEDYREPDKFFSRTYFTHALTDHLGMVLRRLAGKTANTAPVLTLVTQFGGGKTHTLAALYHLANSGEAATTFPGVGAMLEKVGLAAVPGARVGVFVGNAWDPQPDRETPWLDLARQIAGEAGVEALGANAATAPPGTEALGRLFQAANAPVLILCDEVLNFVNRHRALAEHFHAFLQNLTVAMTGTTRGAAVISLPRSQVEMTDWDQEWQARITKVVNRVARDLIVADEAEIAEVVRRRLFEDLGEERTWRRIARAYADWCFERRAQLPPEWTAVDSALTEAKAREFLRERFEACYPFHPATLSVFQRKWQPLAQYQRTRGTLAMLAQWISSSRLELFEKARPEPLITLGSAPLEIREFRAVVLGQVGQDRLEGAILTDLAGPQSHAGALDADTRGPLRAIHRKVGTAIFFESTGGQTSKVAHLPELRFALGSPEIDTTSVDNAALALEQRAFYMRRVGSDGFRLHHQATLKKVVADRRASLDPEREVKPAVEALVRGEFAKGEVLKVEPFPREPSDIPDSPRLKLVVVDPDTPWDGGAAIRERVLDWTKRRGKESRLYPGALVWCFRKPGRDLYENVEAWLGWKRVKKELAEGVLGEDFELAESEEVDVQVRMSQGDARDEVWAGYRFVVLSDPGSEGGLGVIDLGAGHASANETLASRIVAALKANSLLNESVGAGYLERNWPPALKQSGAWPLSGLRQSFLDGSLTRLLDPDLVLRTKIAEFVERGDLGLASGATSSGTFNRVWFREPVPAEEITFDSGVFLLTKARAQELRQAAQPPTGTETPSTPEAPRPDSRSDVPAKPVTPEPDAAAEPGTPEGAGTRTIRLRGTVPPEIWNRLGTRLIPKLRSAMSLRVSVEFEAEVDSANAAAIQGELSQMLEDLGIIEQLRLE